MGFLSNLAFTAGEIARMSKSAKEEEKKMTPETQAQLNRAIAMANDGNAEAMYILGNEYWRGESVRYDPHEAVKWWTQAAEHGHVLAMYNLGVAYEGNESHQFYDENLSGYWFNEAAMRGDQDAQRCLQNYQYSNWRNRWSRRS